MTTAFRPTTIDHLLALEEIRSLVQCYTLCIDTRRHDRRRTNELIELFTEDGVWDSSDNGHGRPEGREALRQFFGGKTVVNMIHHMVTGPLITELTDDEARGICAYTGQVNFTGTSYACLEAGHYYDHYVRTSDGWRFKSRVLQHEFPSRRLEMDVLTRNQSLPDADERMKSSRP